MPSPVCAQKAGRNEASELVKRMEAGAEEGILLFEERCGGEDMLKNLLREEMESMARDK